ncbi:MAG: ABC transporter permease [Ardenticatenaceae bacterium]|nr:ABC transporter permease [Ardenticatenaceae bacterium]HBY93915.1 ABC transporter permease [Chloroflexota bacterium]
MFRFIIQRALQAVVTVIAASIVVFLFVHASGDPAALLVPEEASVKDIARVRTELGLDRPLYVQYFLFMRDFWRGENIKSFRYYEPLLPLILSSLRWTMVLAGSALLISLILAVPLGTIAALTQDSAIDVAIRVIAVFGQSMPSFWVAMLLMLFIAVKLQLLPVSGLGVKNAILPITTLAFFQVAVLMRLLRSEMLEVLHQDYVRTARAKGLRERTVLSRHVFKNAALPVLTMAGLQFSNLVLGAVVVEPIFAWPGLGYLMVNSVFARDYPVVVGGTIVAAVVVTTANLAVDVLYGALDPRIRVG